jgi:hypothetical protein
MTIKVARILGLNTVYVILAHDVTGRDHGSTVVDPVFENLIDAEAFAREYEKKYNYQVYTEIYQMEVK